MRIPCTSGRNSSKFGNILYVDDPPWRDDIILHQRQQIRATRENFLCPLQVAGSKLTA